MFTIAQVLHLKNSRRYMAIPLGIACSLSIYCYWLTDFFQPTSKWVFLFILLSSIGTTTIFLYLIELWIAPRLSILTQLQQWSLFGTSIIAGVLLMFAGTNVSKSPRRYLAFLLPTEKIEISVPASQNHPSSEVAIQSLSTSFGYISYNSIKYQGWQRKGSTLVLTDIKRNGIEWVGKVGDHTTIVFSTPTQDEAIQISQDGKKETINLSSKTGGKYSYTHNFNIPFYASPILVTTLGIIDFSVFCFLVAVLIVEKRKIISEYLDRSILASSIHDNSSPDLNNKGIYKRNIIAIDWAVVIAGILLSILLRIFNLDSLAPLTDEYWHLFAAKAIASGALLNISYQRSVFLVTLPVAIFFRVFGYELWVARLPGVLFNALAIIPLYLTTKKINKEIAFLSCFLYATNPWLIAVSRIVREYGYYPFYFYWIIYAMIVFLERFPDKFLRSNWKKDLKPNIILLAGTVFLPIVYMVRIDPDSTFRVISIAYSVFGLFILSKFVSNGKMGLWLLAAITTVFSIFIYLYVAQIGYISFHPIQIYWLRYFFRNPLQQWYYNRLTLIPVLGLVGVVFLSIKIRKHNFIPLFFCVLFSASLFFYMFFFDRYVQARYLFNIEFWFVPLVAVGVYCIWAFLRLIFPNSNILVTLISLTLLIASLNGPQILYSTSYNSYGWMPITEEYYVDVKKTQTFLGNKVKHGDALISTNYGQYIAFTGDRKFSKVYPYNYQDKNPGDYVLSIVSEHNSGWIVLDDQSYEATRPLSLETTSSYNKKIEFMGKVANELIWQWSTH